MSRSHSNLLIGSSQPFPLGVCITGIQSSYAHCCGSRTRTPILSFGSHGDTILTIGLGRRSVPVTYFTALIAPLSSVYPVELVDPIDVTGNTLVALVD
ncbi:hypothetical protein GDO78_013904 [Eleutherodactylus coqui]|uniref:Uncharacterized protein n=1 Tax=Eleutherodactylus coqui TaxID=57060 RepID=A0A8J6B3L6_ELECQ|nr:hypothetical protein GDO78_013904 [Eleutherodactylus coqui]